MTLIPLQDNQLIIPNSDILATPTTLSDGKLGSWSTATSLPTPVTYSQTIVTKNRVYLIGGYKSGDGCLSTVYTAPIFSDGTLGSWSADSSLPDDVDSSQAIVTKNRVYLLGGTGASGFLSTVYTAPILPDGTLGAWTASTPLPATVSNSQAIVTKNRVYLLGGYNSDDGCLSTVYTAAILPDGTLGTWSAASSLPAPVAYSQAIVTRNRVYLLGGWGSGGALSTVYTAPINQDGTLGSWSTAPAIPVGIYHSQAIVTRNRVYLLGGIGVGGISSTVYTAPILSDGTLGAWNTASSLPVPLALSQATATKNRVYLIGGYSGGALSTVYTAPILPDDSLDVGTTSASPPTPSPKDPSMSLIPIQDNQIIIPVKDIQATVQVLRLQEYILAYSEPRAFVASLDSERTQDAKNLRTISYDEAVRTSARGDWVGHILIQVSARQQVWFTRYDSQGDVLVTLPQGAIQRSIVSKRVAGLPPQDRPGWLEEILTNPKENSSTSDTTLNLTSAVSEMTQSEATVTAKTALHPISDRERILTLESAVLEMQKTIQRMDNRLSVWINA